MLRVKKRKSSGNKKNLNLVVIEGEDYHLKIVS